jgi:hypothetical protein
MVLVLGRERSPAAMALDASPGSGRRGRADQALRSLGGMGAEHHDGQGEHCVGPSQAGQAAAEQGSEAEPAAGGRQEARHGERLIALATIHGKRPISAEVTVAW